MPNFVYPLLLALAAGVNIYGFVITWADKRMAQQRQRRVPERKLFAIAWLFGSVGVYAAMWVFRHKTRHASFVWGIPGIMLAQAAVIYALCSLAGS